MKKINLSWTLSHSKTVDGVGEESIPATVPGAVQLDYARENNYEPYYYGLNFKQFDWIEDEYFFYDTTLNFSCSKWNKAFLVFEGIDYKYDISINNEVIQLGEGAFTPVKIDITKFSGKRAFLRVTIYPIPKKFPEPQNRSQASACFKPPSSYGWDWHPRLVPSGIWKDAYIDVVPYGSPRDLEASYVLSDDLSSVTVNAEVKMLGKGVLVAELISPDGEVVANQVIKAEHEQKVHFKLKHNNPQLWYPRGYGEQPIYTLRVSGWESVERKIGFRQSKLVLNSVGGIYTTGYPKGPEPAPMQIEINGKKVFAKGSNWVNTEIFPCLATKERYNELIQLAYDANMNMFRMWGGQYINHDCFYEKCDELGIMVWQEFMMSCNKYPDTDEYLTVLKQEATSIIKSLRTHPCITFWCGGNELFNNWSGMTQQSHALRLLDKLCYDHDRYTPFNMTSPLYGVVHGSYVKVVFPKGEEGHEFICDVKNSKATAYTEFGCNGASNKEYILKYIMDEKDYADCNENNPIWTAHHAFRAWSRSAWIGSPDVQYFFGGYKDTDDLIEKSIYLQDMCYTSMFEEMRRQAPVCSMAINWDFNEPWPCAAGNALVAWPAEPRSALLAVGQALRPTLFSLDIPHNRYLTGDTLVGSVWVLNDSECEAEACKVEVYIVSGGAKTKIAEIETDSVSARENKKFGAFEISVEKDIDEEFSVLLECVAHPEWSSTYHLVHKKDAVATASISENTNVVFGMFEKNK